MTLHHRMFFVQNAVKGILALIVTGAILSGCASEHGCSTKPTFFPPPPDEPRIQWLTGISNSKEIGVKESQSTFSIVVTGQEAASVIRKIGKSYGVAVRNGKIYVAETNEGRVTVIDPVNATFEYLKGLANPKGALQAPANLAFDKEGYLYVADTGRREIVVYDQYENYVTAFGRGLALGSKIVSVALYGENLYALDAGTSRIRVLNRKTGEETAVLGYIEKPNQSLRFPSNFTIDAKGSIYVTNTGNNKVMKYDIDGNFLGAFGANTDQLGNFVKPKGIDVDNAGRIFVADGGLNIVQIFDDQFRLLTLFGWPGLETGSLNLPAGVAVTNDANLLRHYQKFAVKGFQLESLIFVVNQAGAEFCIPRISIFGLGQMQGGK